MIFCDYFKDDKDAVIPYKSRESDAGYDLTIIKKVKNIGSKSAMYDTGIKLLIDDGYYGEIVPRSSIINSGYMLSNSIGIIDPAYTGTLKIVLTKIDESLPDLVLPFRCAQILFKKVIHVYLQESTFDFSNNTERGGRGFGESTK